MSQPRDSDSDRTQVILQPGTVVFGRYTLEQIVGEGGMGVVWRARDEKLERDVALKFLPDRVRRDPQAIRDLKRETNRCLSLTHENIVRVYDFVEDSTAAAIAMEYVPGKSLSALKAARPGGCFDACDLAPLVHQLGAALDYAHTRAKIVHRDLKPGNLLVTEDGVLKVADFGIARSLRETDTRQTSDLRGASGTLAFMGPEQLLNKRAQPTDDVYALGATLYDLLTGKPPFYAGDIMTQIRTEPPAPLAEHREGLGNEGAPIPPDWEQTIFACLAKRAEDRPASAGAVLAMLEGREAFSDKTVQIAVPAVPAPPLNVRVPREVVPEKARGPEEGQPWTIPELGLVLLPIAAGSFVMGSPASKTRRYDDESPQTRVTLSKGFWLGKTQVTQKEWAAVMASWPSDFHGDALPVEHVWWRDAMEFCRKLTERERAADRLPAGLVYTLPTEAQWEYACRAGTTGDYAGELDAMGWSDENSGGTTHAVGTKRANAWGLHDMHGNVWEWCADWKDAYPGGTVRDPKGDASDTYHVLRGGSCFQSAGNCRSAVRHMGGPGGFGGNAVGFRLALSVSP